MREGTPGTVFWTSPEHPARTSHGPGRVRSARFSRGNRARATFRQTGAPRGGRKLCARHSKYRNLRPCRIAVRFASSSPVQGHRDRVPCSARKGWGRDRGFPARSSDAENSQFLLAAIGAVLRGADEHFAEIIVQCIVELALEAPFELGMVKIAGMEIEVVRMHGKGGILELNYDFDAFAFGARGKVQERML